MSYFSGKQKARDWLSLGYGMMEGRPKGSPRLAAMQRMRAKRAALKQARAADHQEESQQGDQRPSKARKTVSEFQQNQPVQPPPPTNPSLPSTRVLRRASITLQLFPENDDDNPMYRSNIIGVRRAWVTRADGERMNGLLRWSETVDDVIINCDCHNLIFSPEGFLNHAGLKGISMDRPLRHIIVSMDPVSQEYN